MPNRISSSGTKSRMVGVLFTFFFHLLIHSPPQTTTFRLSRTRSRVYVVLLNVVVISTRPLTLRSFFWSIVVLAHAFLYFKNLSLVSPVTPHVECNSYPPHTPLIWFQQIQTHCAMYHRDYCMVFFSFFGISFFDFCCLLFFSVLLFLHCIASNLLTITNSVVCISHMAALVRRGLVQLCKLKKTKLPVAVTRNGAQRLFFHACL